MSKSEIYKTGYEEGENDGMNQKESKDDFDMSSKKVDYQIGYILGYVSGCNVKAGGFHPYEYQAHSAGELLRNYGLDSDNEAVKAIIKEFKGYKNNVMEGINSDNGDDTYPNNEDEDD